MNPWIPVWENRELLISGFWLTVMLCLVCIVTSTVLGFIIALIARSRSLPAAVGVRVYIEFFRGSPVLILILFVFFGAAYARVAGLTPFSATVIALTLYTAANIAEVFRAGFEAVPHGQTESGRSLGLAKTDVLWFIVLPQAMKVALPPLFGQYITLIKNSALAAVIGYPGLVRQAQGIISRHNDPFEVLFVVAVLYFIICFPLSLIARKLERRTAS